MGSAGVVERPPIIEQHLGVFGGVEDFLIEAFCAQAGMEALGKAVLPNGSHEVSPLDQGLPGRVFLVPMS